MVYIENEGALFRGLSRAWPEEVWSVEDKKWLPYSRNVPKDIGWGTVIPENEADEMMERMAKRA